jgi:PAS domain S-box-containing protein
MPALEALRHAVIVTDTAGIVTYWNTAAHDLLGWTSAEAVGQRLHDLAILEPTTDELIGRLDTDPDWSGEMALRKRKGMAFLARVHQVPVSDDLGQVTGIIRLVSDITDVTWTQRREREEGERARRALEAAGVGSWHIDLASGLVTWDSTMEALYGLEEGTFPGSRRGWLDRIHAEDRDWVEGEIARLIAVGGGSVDVEYRVGRPDGSLVWLHCVGKTFLSGGTPTTIAGVAFDITERHRAEEERSAFLASERARRDRFTLLAEASSAFAASLADEDVIAAVGRLAVPRLADWFAIDIADPAGIRTAATGHHEAGKNEVLRDVGLRFGAGRGILPEVPRVIAEARARLLQRPDIEATGDGSLDAEHRAALERVGLHSAVVVPLTARGRTFGAMTFAIGDSDLSYSTEDVNLAEDLARRAALSIDNARLFADRAHVARVLQRSLLPPELPDVPGATIAARYRAAVAGSEIGGDFYDVFQTSDERWSLVLGDVSGKGTDAAVLTGLARHTVRAAAMGAEGPFQVLSALNHAILAQDYGERFVTLAYVQMALSEGSAELCVSSAGHPNPLVRRASGAVEEIREVGGIIGLFEDVAISQETVTLAGGDLLVLYTDGVLEARDSSGEFYGDTRLRDLLAASPGTSPDAVAESIEADVLAFQDGNPRDDIAILVVGIDDPAVAPVQEHSP